MEAEAPAPGPVESVPNTLEQGWVKGYYITETLPELESGVYKDVSRDAVWQISNARAGNGIEQLMDESLETYWQSDGIAPHTVNIQFYARQSLAEICLYIDYKVDESYSPDHVVVRTGTTHQDLEDVRDFRLVEPVGWVRVPVGNKDGVGMSRYLRTWMVQISLISMHQNGRDGHLRTIKLLGPADSDSLGAFPPGLLHAARVSANGHGPSTFVSAFDTPEMQRFADVR